MDERFEIYQNDNGEFRGRLVRANGENVVDAREKQGTEAGFPGAADSAPDKNAQQ
jgi:uncharacterized protein YegP (UPF0339 family)